MPPKTKKLKMEEGYTAASLYDKFGPGSKSAATSLAREYGVKVKEMLEYMADFGKSKDANKKTAFAQGRNMGMPIFSQRRGGWQFDTVVPKNHKEGDPYYLWFTNVNTKLTRAYAMANKGTDEVYKAMNAFLKDNADRGTAVTQLSCDRDPAYTDARMLELLNKQNINLRTTTNTTKHALGVVNRSIRTIRDRIANTHALLKSKGKLTGDVGNMPIEEVNKKLSGWNTRKNKNLNGKSPVFLSSKEGEDDELDIIATKMNIADERREKALKGIKVGQTVRRFDPEALNGNKEHAQRNLDPYNYKIHAIDKYTGKLTLGGKDPTKGFIQVPRFQVLTDKSYLGGEKKIVPPDNPDLEKTVESITSPQKNGVYNVKYQDGTSGTRTVRQLRGSQPMKPLEMETDIYLKNQTVKRMATRRGGNVFADMPANIKDYLPKIMPDIPNVLKACEK